METKVIDSKTANQTINKANPVTEENKKVAFVAGNPVNKDSAKPETVKETPKVEQVKPKEEAKAEAPKAEAPKQEAPKAEPVKAEEVKPEPKKFVLNLEGTLKFIEEKHRLVKQRVKLQDTINNLDAFDVELRDEADTTDTNYYNGCVLTIQDDKRNTFETKNPTIIWTVAQLVNHMCVEKLAEIEAGIVLPQA